jgi:hypothetical protein
MLFYSLLSMLIPPETGGVGESTEHWTVGRRGILLLSETKKPAELSLYLALFYTGEARWKILCKIPRTVNTNLTVELQLYDL